MAALPEDSSSIPSSHSSSCVSVTPVPGNPTLSSSLYGHCNHLVYRHTCTHTPIHTTTQIFSIKNKFVLAICSCPAQIHPAWSYCLSLLADSSGSSTLCNTQHMTQHMVSECAEISAHWSTSFSCHLLLCDSDWLLSFPNLGFLTCKLFSQ